MCATSVDLDGNDGVPSRNNGKYVMVSTKWANGIATNAGAVTCGSGTSGVSGAVTSSNSLVGTTGGDIERVNSVRSTKYHNYTVESGNGAHDPETFSGT